MPSRASSKRWTYAYTVSIGTNIRFNNYIYAKSPFELLPAVPDIIITIEILRCQCNRPTSYLTRTLKYLSISSLYSRLTRIFTTMYLLNDMKCDTYGTILRSTSWFHSRCNVTRKNEIWSVVNQHVTWYNFGPVVMDANQLCSLFMNLLPQGFYTQFSI